jgi:aryl-alcohol dehydrogenase-like predicted oxidoreductase
MLDQVAEAGVNFIDTADVYPAAPDASTAGSSEEITGRWIKGKRGQFILSTKGGGPMGPAAWDRGGSRKHLLDAIDSSLRRLGTDYVDLYQLHADDLATPIDETVEAMDTIVRSGKARYIGASNFLAYRLAKALGRQNHLGLMSYVSVQSRYSLISRDMERELLPLAQEEGIAVLPYSPLAGGLLSGQYKYSDTPKTGRFSAATGRYGVVIQERYWHEREFSAVEKIKSVAEQRGISIATLSVAWLLAQPTNASVILGASRLEQLTDTIAAHDYKLDDSCKLQLDEITAEFRRGNSTK